MVEPGAIKTPFFRAPDATPLRAYSPCRERFFEAMRKKAPGPEVVAEVFARLVRSKHPPLRNRVTSEATLFSLLRWALPSGAFESGLRAGFGLDRRKRA